MQKVIPLLGKINALDDPRNFLKELAQLADDLSGVAGLIGIFNLKTI